MPTKRICPTPTVLRWRIAAKWEKTEREHQLEQFEIGKCECDLELVEPKFHFKLNAPKDPTTERKVPKRNRKFSLVVLVTQYDSWSYCRALSFASFPWSQHACTSSVLRLRIHCYCGYAIPALGRYTHAVRLMSLALPHPLSSVGDATRHFVARFVSKHEFSNFRAVSGAFGEHTINEWISVSD